MQNNASEWIVYQFQDLKDLPPVCLTGLQRSSGSDIELGAPWLANLVANALPNNERPAFFLARRSGSETEFVLLPVRTSAATRRLDTLTTFYSSIYRPVIETPDPDGALTAIFRDVSAQGYSEIWLHPLEHESPVFTCLSNGLIAAGWWTFPYFSFYNWYLDLHGRAFSDFFSALPSQLRNTVNRRKKRFLADGRGRTAIVAGGAELESAIEAYSHIYAKSWKTPEPFPDFVPQLIRLCAENSWLRLGLAYYDDVPIAAQIWIVSQRRAAIFKLAYDEGYAQFSAGSILTSELMRHVIDNDCVDEVDYLIGDDAYKKDWMSARRERWGICAYNPRTVAGLFRGIRSRARQWAKAFLKAPRRHN